MAELLEQFGCPEANQTVMNTSIVQQLQELVVMRASPWAYARAIAHPVTNSTT
jgi:hypothetical protein